uniref:Ig-like domain-containing protein n=1 Tax=Romanomermis culicivorax TaxID=13658 RepID=A0A915LCR6_ROMCU
ILRYKGEQPLQYGHRFRPINDFGFCILDILYMTADDSGDYFCLAENETGQDHTGTSIQVAQKDGLILEPQAPEKARAVADLERNMGKVSEAAPLVLEKQAPIFVVPLQDPPVVQEMGHAYFSARVLPSADPEMQIQWYLNGNPLTTGSRVKTINDFGYTILEVNPVYPEDSGEYVCKAWNSVGEAVTKATLKCEPKKPIIVESQLPEKMSGAQRRIAILDAPKVQVAPLPDKTYGPPKFKTPLNNMMDLV